LALPYSFASIFFLLFISSALYYFIKFIYCEKEKYLLLWSIFLTFAFLSRIEMTLLLWGGFVSAGVLFVVQNKDEQRWKWVIYLFTPLIICFLVYFLFLYNTHAFAGFKECLADQILLHKNSYLTKAIMRTDNLLSNILILFYSLGIQASTVLLLGIVSAHISSFFKRNEKSQLVLISIILLLFFLFIFSKKYIGVFLQFRYIPLILIIGIIFFLTNIFRSYEINKNISLLTIFLISFFMIVRVLFAVTPHTYGFFLTSLALVCYYFFFFEIIPKIFIFLFPSYSILFSKSLFSLLLACLFLYLAFSHWCITRDYYKLKNFQIKTDRGNIFFRNDQQTIRYWETIVYLRENTSRDDTIVVLPEGIGINFFSNRENPTGYCNFTPPVCELISEEKIIDRFEKTSIDYILIVNRETREYGFPHFGVDYGKKIDFWIKKHYRSEKLIGPYPFTEPEFSAALFKKK